MRNWRPENERAEVDAVIRKARAAGIDCAPWEAGSIEAIVATAVDGAAAQGFLLISPVGRKKRISSLLTKGGIVDAWSGEPESRRSIEMSLAATGMDTPTLAVSRSYLDRIVAHELALSIEKREAPPFGLLQVAETIGGADWQPARMAFGETLAGLIAEVPKVMCEPAALASVLRKSNELPELGAVAQSWFEDDRWSHKRWSAHAAVIARSLLPIFCRASLHDVATDGLRLSCARPFGCARRPGTPTYAGANSRSSQRRSPTDGI
jgi:hypothetical protein